MKPENVSTPTATLTSDLDPTLDATRYAQYRVIKRNGQLAPFDPARIAIAITKAFIAVEGHGGDRPDQAPERIHHSAEELVKNVINSLSRRMEFNGTVHIEDIQDQVELELMRAGEHKVARDYVLYREQHAAQRATRPGRTSALNVTDHNGNLHPLDETRLYELVAESCADLDDVDPELVVADSLKNLYDGIPAEEVNRVLVMTARMLIEKEPNYTYVAARLLLDTLRSETLGLINSRDGAQHMPTTANATQMAELYTEYFKRYIQAGVDYELLSPTLTEFDLERLAAAIQPQRDFQFTYLGFQTLYDRYFLHWGEVRFELPQAFFMRVAMGLSLNEIDREARAIEFYNLLSSFDCMSSTPTLFNAGTLRSQLSSCYLSTVPDDLHGIYSAIRDNALLSKFAGGLGNDWTPVRAMGAWIKGTNGKSQGIVPFMKVANDTLVAVNQCFAPDTLLHTSEGVKAIKDIEKGDLVLGQHGAYREVQQRMAYNQTDPMVEIEVKHAISPLRVTSGHPLWTLSGVPMEQANQRSYEWLQKGKITPQWQDAGTLQKGDYVAQVIPKEVVPVADFDEDEARLYGILLGDGHCTQDGMEWGVCGNPNQDVHLQFVRDYLQNQGIHFWEKGQRENYLQISWAQGCELVRDATTGQFARGNATGFIFKREDLYDADGHKRIARQYAHLPKNQTLALLQGLIETDGGISRGKEIYFTNTSQALIEGLRYQLLRLGVPCAGQYREREQDHTGQRADGTQIEFKGVCKAYDLRIPAIPEIARRVGCQALSKQNWLSWKGWLFTRIRSVSSIAPLPFVYDLKVEGDESYMTTSALAHNGGKRLGSGCAYLETWHLDIEEFLELRKNTGDERRRTHDMNTANWVPDLFMKRVHQEAEWTLFSPDETPDLHELFGAAFEQRYHEYEEQAALGKLRQYKKVSAVQLWRKMLTMLFETGHPWMTFKDPCNIRSPQQHVGVVHSSNLCTEIALNTSEEEIAVCNLMSVNLPAHTTENGLDMEKLARTLKTAMRMLDNVIDINYYSVPQARRSNLRHRPVGLGLMGFQDALYKQRIAYASDAAVEFADKAMEAISYHAILGSTLLAEERGKYATFDGSLWSQGILPIDSLQALAESRGEYLELDDKQTLDWDSLRQQVQTNGMRNSNCMAIAPTATISNVSGVTQSIEPTFQNLYVKSNLSGEFTVVNPYLVADLKALDLWDEMMVNDLKYFDGSVQDIERIPEAIKALYATAFEIDPKWLIDAGARRQKWLDQSQSLNLYMREPSGKRLDELYKHAWLRGLKTTYYLRSMGATQVEKNTVQATEANMVNASDMLNLDNSAPLPAACSIDDPECEACQ
ncbi:ribonucleoside-diphosphate reductase subunit alpha [Candidatus Venteria ishoeyi]|uniref:ribonucleoside-diphosphate reductase subunit alpha n=1 Tax=Candidatus Venteria ishoeyi TaxID=1899563 RepID=UPI0025A64D0D|nr:ribonucleoside-diphosphate reductase subunit alpha [Candidatus Venteria ishoeyi]MDM8546195.1 ribonucleoside-diphosphate reductase subunit alpha [Candidatus Venteria ishoeyi]